MIKHIESVGYSRTMTLKATSKKKQSIAELYSMVVELGMAGCGCEVETY